MSRWTRRAAMHDPGMSWLPSWLQRTHRQPKRRGGVSPGMAAEGLAAIMYAAMRREPVSPTISFAHHLLWMAEHYRVVPLNHAAACSGSAPDVLLAHATRMAQEMHLERTVMGQHATWSTEDLERGLAAIRRHG